jgi:cytochrome P450
MPLVTNERDLLPFRDEDYRQDPYPFYDEIRTQGDVYFHPMGMYVITKHEHVSRLLRERSMSVLQIDFGPASALHDSMLGQDMPDHTRLRRATNEWFAPAAIQQLRENIQNRVDALISNAESTGQIEAVLELAYPLTNGLMCEILGVDDEGSTLIRDKTFDFGLSLGPGASDEDLLATAAASDWFVEYINNLIEKKRSNPGEGMLDELIKMSDEGTMTHDEVVATTFLFFAVGHLDVSYLIINGLRIFAENPEVLAAYRDQPELRPNIINEILRFDTPEQFVSRLTTEDIQVGDVVIPAGEMVVLMIGAANKDPQIFDAPHEFDVQRPNSAKHLAFSGGIHGCVGQILARAEADVVFTTIVNRFPDLHLAGEPTWGHTEFIRAMHKLPLALK